MKLYDSSVDMLSSLQDEKVTDDELKKIQKKSGKKALKICFPILSVITLIAIIYTWVEEKEFPLFYILFFIFLCLPMTIHLLKNKEIYAYHGTVTDKIVRCAKVSGRGTVYLPFEATKEIGTYKHKYTLSETVCEFYYCTVEINGKIYDNVCCYKKDFQKINVGDRVIISIDDCYGYLPVVYKCSGDK